LQTAQGDTAVTCNLQLATCALTLPWHRLRFDHTNAVRATLAERYAPSTRGPSGRRYLAALRGVIKACWQLDLIDQQTLAKTLTFKPLPGESEAAAAGRSLSFREMSTLMAHLQEQGVNGLRDAALIAVAYAGGLRRQELANLDLDDYDPTNGTLRVLRKRQKRHTIYVEDEGTKQVLGEWLRARGNEPGPLFYRVHKGGRIEAARLHPQTISDLLDAGVDLATVQKVAGQAQRRRQTPRPLDQPLVWISCHIQQNGRQGAKPPNSVSRIPIEKTGNVVPPRLARPAQHGRFRPSLYQTHTLQSKVSLTVPLSRAHPA
jgi:integrase